MSDVTMVLGVPVKVRTVPNSRLIAAYSDELKPLLVHATSLDELWPRVHEVIEALRPLTTGPVGK